MESSFLDVGCASTAAKLRRDVALQQPGTVFGEYRMVPGRIVDALTGKVFDLGRCIRLGQSLEDEVDVSHCCKPV